jgi:hypothetical protein
MSQVSARRTFARSTSELIDLKNSRVCVCKMTRNNWSYFADAFSSTFKSQNVNYSVELSFGGGSYSSAICVNLSHSFLIR